ncbi:MAG: hypothetical protein L0H15_01710 [Nitrosospira sp.]|nr:hypothetical protein [Nitrosospira sp.]MDN5934826.1 hypothetical protein [Nitrosospira sp.]
MGDKADLGICLVTTHTVDLAVEVAGVNEENGVGARHAPFAFRSTAIITSTASLDELLANFLYAAARIRGEVGHDETGAALVVEAGIEQLYQSDSSKRSHLLKSMYQFSIAAWNEPLVTCVELGQANASFIIDKIRHKIAQWGYLALCSQWLDVDFVARRATI